MLQILKREDSAGPGRLSIGRSVSGIVERGDSARTTRYPGAVRLVLPLLAKRLLSPAQRLGPAASV